MGNHLLQALLILFYQPYSCVETLSPYNHPLARLTHKYNSTHHYAKHLYYNVLYDLHAHTKIVLSSTFIKILKNRYFIK